MSLVRTLGRRLADVLRDLSHARFYSLAIVSILLVVFSVTSTVISLNSLFFYTRLPYPGADHLIEVHGSIQHDNGQMLVGNSRGFTEAWLDELKGTGKFALSLSSSARIELTASDEQVGLAYVDRSFFSVLGVPAKLGSTFDQMPPEAIHTPVAVISAGLATRIFGDKEAVDQDIIINRTHYRIGGVMPVSFQSPKTLAGEPEDVWLPLPDTKGESASWRDFSTNLTLIGRLNDGQTSASVTSLLTTLTIRLLATDAHGILPAGTSVKPIVENLREAVVGNAYRAGLTLLGITVLLALLGFSIAGTLLMSRTAARRPTLAVHMVIGASGRDALAFVAMEVTVLSVIAAVLAIPLNGYCIRVVRFLAADTLPRLDELSLGLAPLASLAGFAIVAGVIVSWLGIRSMVGPSLVGELASGEKGATVSGHFRARAIILGAQFFLIVGTLCASSFVLHDALTRLDTSVGFREEGSIYAQLFMPDNQRSAVSKRDVFDQIKSTLTKAAKIKIAPVDMPPISHGLALYHVTRDNQQPIGEFAVNGVGRAYLEGMGMHLLHGRFFEDDDFHDRPNSIVLGESAAALVGGKAGAIGQHVQVEGQDYTIVGVVNDIVNPVSSIPSARLQGYTPFEFSDDVPTLGFFAFGITPDKAEAIERVIREAAPQAAIDGVMPTAELRIDLVREYYVKAAVSAALVILIILMAGAGAEAVIRYMFIGTSREMATKIAIGAQMHHLVSDLAFIVMKPLCVALVAFMILVCTLGPWASIILKLPWLSIVISALTTCGLLAGFVWLICIVTARRMICTGYTKLLQAL